MKAQFRARIHDPVGPRWTRLVLPLMALTVGALDYAWAALDSATPGPAFYLAAVLLFWARPLLGRHRPKNCDVVMEAGRVVIKGAGLLNQTIHTEDVGGASTSVAPDGGTSMAIARSGRGDRPVHLEVASAEDADKIRQALGVGFGGYGSLRWRMRGTSVDLAVTVARVVGTALALILALAAVHEEPMALGALIPMITCMLFVYAVPFALPSLQGLLWFNEKGIFYGKSRVVTQIPYSEIESDTRGKRLKIKRTDGTHEDIRFTRTRHSLLGVTDFELDHVLAQIDDATKRAHGEVQSDGQLEAPGVEILARSSSDDAQGWLTRLDSLASNMGGGYRSINLTKEALAAALADPDAPADVRAGAVRVLYRIDADETKTRVSEVVEAVRDPHLRKRMRVMLEADVTEAATALADIDQREAKAKSP